MMERILTLRRAIVLAVVISLLLPAALISGLAWHSKYDAGVRKGVQELLQQNTEILSTALQEPLAHLNRDSASAVVESIVVRNPDVVRVDVRDGAGTLFVTREQAERRGVSGSGAALVKPISFKGQAIGEVEVEVSSVRLRKALLDGLLESVLALGAQVALSVGLILILLEKRLVRPLQQLRMGAERLAARQLEVPFTWNRLDEIGQLSRRMEETRASLQQLFGELDSKNRELERDIIKRQHIEQELHEREARYRALVEQSPIAIIEWDTDFHVIEWNAAAEKIFGYSREEALGQHASFIVPNVTRELVDKIFRNLTLHAGGSHGINHNRRADGQIITCQWSNAHIPDKDGKAHHLLSMAQDITEKRQSEEARSLSEAKFAGAFQVNPDAVSITRISDGMILDVNQAFELVTGFSREESVGKTTLALDLWVEPQERMALYEQLHVYKTVRDFNWKMRTRNGGVRLCQTNGTIFSIGREQYVLTVARDVTDQRRIEEQKSEADRALLRLAQGTRDIAGESFFELLVADIASALRIDRAFIGLCGTESPQRIHTLAAHQNGKTAKNFEYMVKGSPCECILSGEICVFSSGIQPQFPEDRALVEQGWESYAGAPIRDAAGNTVGVLTVMHSQPLANPDLVKSLLQVFSERASAELERKRVEQVLRNSEQRFSAIFHSSPVAMSVARFGKDHAMVDVNRAFERLWLYERAAVVGKSDSELGLYADAERKAINKAIRAKGYIDRYEVWVKRGDGSKALFMLSGNTFELDGDKFVIFTGEDVTEKHDIENEVLELNETLEDRVIERTEELQQANQELESTLDTLNMAQEELVRSEKLAALGALVAGIAHELNTPIGNSLMVASTLVDRTRALSKNFNEGLKRSLLEKYINDASQAGDILERNLSRAANLVTSFKQVAVDQTSSQRRQFSLAEVVDEIILTLSPTIKKTSFSVEAHIPDDLLMDSYPGPLGQVLTNLINNAFLHGFEGRDAGVVMIDAQPVADDYIELTIRDNGIGIPAHNLNRIFDPFFTTKLGAGGSGLGLPITHNIVSSVLGGRIRLQSEVDIGTTFVLVLPLVAPQAQVEEEAPPQHKSAVKTYLG
jgi:PAS domain S-box-containing protein